MMNKKIYTSAARYGCEEIIKSKLHLNEGLLLPVTIPHGIDTYHMKTDLDIHNYEPIYMAFRDDIAERAKKFKTVLKFPHPWLLIISEYRNQIGKGTLFIAPPPSLSSFEAVVSKITAGNFPKPWGILIKERGAKVEDYEWWSNNGFVVHTAGLVSDSNFFYNLRNIFVNYECVASPNMSSAVIFAVAMGRKAYALPDVEIEIVDTGDWEEVGVFCDTLGKIKNAWLNLLSSDLTLARIQAEDLLGMKYMDHPEKLKERLMMSIDSVKDVPVHLFPLKNGLLYKFCVWLIINNIPIQKFFPKPISKLKQRILFFFHLNKLCVIRGSDFAHYGIAGTQNQLQLQKVFAFQLGESAVPGRAIRASKLKF